MPAATLWQQRRPLSRLLLMRVATASPLHATAAPLTTRQSCSRRWTALPPADPRRRCTRLLTSLQTAVQRQLPQQQQERRRSCPRCVTLLRVQLMTAQLVHHQQPNQHQQEAMQL